MKKGKMTQEELHKILENHQHWINKDCDGWENMRAELSGKDLSGVDLSGADLRGAKLHNLNLNDANLRNVNLRDANINGTRGSLSKNKDSFER